MRIVVYLGPSLATQQARALLEAEYRPPARQGDIYRLVRDEPPEAIGLVDGYFRETASVWHREILFALHRGVHVFGAASMGALRAAELHMFGMQGVGRVFEAYRDGVFPPSRDAFDGDAEVAVEHGPPEAGSIATSLALVDARAAFAAAQRAGLLDDATRERLVASAAAIHFADRGYAAILARAGLEPDESAALAEWIAREGGSQKAADARALLLRLAAFRAEPFAPFRPAFTFQATLAWERFRRACDAEDEARLDARETAILDEIRLDAALYERLRREAALTVGAGSRDADVRAGLDRLRARHALPRRADIEAWARLNAIDAAGLRRIAADEARLAASGAPSPRAILRRAQAEGLASALDARAALKREALADVEGASRPPTRAEFAAFALWSRARGLDPEAEEAAHPSEWPGLFRALWREYLYAAQASAQTGGGGPE